MPRIKATNRIDKRVGSRIMRRLMLKLSLPKLGDALGITFQQVHKYEKGMDRISASRLQHIAQILQVPATFFFEDPPNMPAARSKKVTARLDPIMDFMATSEGLALAKAFTRIRNGQVRRRIVDLVRWLAAGSSGVIWRIPVSMIA